jgi:hypothetical protein
LGFPERVYSTLVRAAKTSETFKDVTFHLRPASPAKHVSFATLPAPATRSAKKISSPPRPLPLPPKHEKLKQVQRSAVIAKPQPQPRKTPQLQPTSASLTPKPQTAQPSPPVQEKSKRLQHFEPADITHSQPPPAPVSSSDPLDVLRPYLPEENKDTSILRLSPASRPPLARLSARYCPAHQHSTPRIHTPRSIQRLDHLRLRYLQEQTPRSTPHWSVRSHPRRSPRQARHIRRATDCC